MFHKIQLTIFVTIQLVVILTIFHFWWGEFGMNPFLFFADAFIVLWCGYCYLFIWADDDNKDKK